jgi:prepilin-type N-terminal cleavage/methylation domain-containing protein
MRRRRGFTLWEMAIVLLLLAVTAGIALPAFTRLGERDDTHPADALTQLLRNARRMAVERGTNVRVVLDPESGHFRVDTLGVAGAGVIAEDTLALSTTGTRLEADAPRVRYLFRATGAAIADSIIVRGAGKAVVVLVDPWSGAPRAEAR